MIFFKFLFFLQICSSFLIALFLLLSFLGDIVVKWVLLLPHRCVNTNYPVLRLLFVYSFTCSFHTYVDFFWVFWLVGGLATLSCTWCLVVYWCPISGVFLPST